MELRENLLRTLPESMSQLTKLERLDLGDNDIEILVSCHLIYINIFLRKALIGSRHILFIFDPFPISLSLPSAGAYWQFAFAGGTLVGSQSISPAAQRAMPVDQLGVFGRLGESP